MVALKGTIYVNRGTDDLVEDWSWRDVSREPREPRKGNKLKLSGSQERHRKPTHRSSRVISYRLVQEQVA